MCEFINTFLKPVIYLTCQLFLTIKISFCFNTKTLYFSGCKLLYKQDFARRLGLRCVTCNYCSQLCKKGATRELDGVVRDFCSEECCRRFQDWYYKASTPAGLTPGLEASLPQQGVFAVGSFNNMEYLSKVCVSLVH